MKDELKSCNVIMVLRNCDVVDQVKGWILINLLNNKTVLLIWWKSFY